MPGQTARMTKEDRRLEQQGLHRDLYVEVCEEQGFIPLPAATSRSRATADLLRWLNVRAFATGGKV